MADILERISLINMDSSVLIGCGTFLSTFLLVVISYVYLFKRKSPAANQSLEADSSCQDPPTPKQLDTGGDSINQTTTACAKDVSSSDGAGEMLPPRDGGMCPFAALGDLATVNFDHIPAKVKQTEQNKIKKAIEKNMSTEDLEKEREAQREQMRQIFELMQGKEESFGISDMSEMNEQMKLYM